MGTPLTIMPYPSGALVLEHDLPTGKSTGLDCPAWGRHALVHSHDTRLPQPDIRWEWLGSCCAARRITEDIVERVADGGYLGDDGGFIVDVGLGDDGRGEWVEQWGSLPR